MNNSELSIIVPVYNEENTIQAVMHRLQDVCGSAEHIYVNDGSSDKSLEVLKSNTRSELDTVISKENGGKGSAIRMGLEKARGTFTAIQDADLEYDPAELLMLLDEIKNREGAVFGSRFLQENPNIYKRFLIGNKVLTGMMNALFGSRLTDSYTCFKMMKTDDFRSLNLRANGFELEAEITAKCLKRKIPIHEVPITYNPRTLEEGKKISWKDAWKGMVMMAKTKFSK